MKREIYEAMKSRISIYDYAKAYQVYERKGWKVSQGATFYLFDNNGLNEGIDELDELYIDSVIQPMQTRNIWNVCQRFYSFVRCVPDIDKRLLNSKK